MPDEIRINRAQSSPAPMQATTMQAESALPAKSSKTPWLILALVVIVIAICGFLFRAKLFKGSNGSVLGVTTPGSGYQAVFLTNGQVYFGKISNTDNNYVTLKDIYYLQVGPQQGSGTNVGDSAAAAPQQSISLVKLGQELHGPVDEMHISRSQILFYEDLKDDGSVVKAIDAYVNPAK